MTVGTKVHQALASLRSLEGQFEMFALDTEDQQAKQMYNQCRQQLSQISQQMADRVNYMEQEEPTYKISSSTPASGGAANQYTAQSSLTGAASMTDMTSPHSQTTFGTVRSVGSTASTGSTGTNGWSSPSNSTGGNKSTKKKSR